MSALQTRELSQKKDDLKQQIQTNIQQKKTYIEETQNDIKKLEEELLHKQNNVKCYKDHTKSLRGNNSLLLQYVKTLEAELEMRQENCNQDMKMYQERIESYGKVFEQHKEQYCRNPLAKQLLKIQTENEEIEQRIRACEDQILAKEKELQALQGETVKSSLIENASESNLSPAEFQDQTDEQTEEIAQPQDEISTLHDTQLRVSLPIPLQAQENNSFIVLMESFFQTPYKLQSSVSEPQHDDSVMEEGLTEENQDKADGRNASQVGTSGSIARTSPEKREQMQGPDQRPIGEPEELEGNLNMSGGAEIMEEGVEDMDTEGQKQAPLIVGEEGNEERAACPQSSPARMKALLSTPTFSLNSSPNNSPGRHGGSETKSPTFVFSMNSDPNTPGFSGFDCRFGMESAQEEDAPFVFTSSYFNDKKSSGSKFSGGFLFDQPESRPEEDFGFSFASKSTQPTSATQETGGAGDAFPFSFNF